MCRMPCGCGSFLTIPCQTTRICTPELTLSRPRGGQRVAELSPGSLVLRPRPCTMIGISAGWPKRGKDAQMRWRGGRESQNVEDRRDESGGFSFPGGGVAFPSGGGSGRGGGIGIIGILIILALMWFFGIDPTVLMQGGPGGEGNFPDIHLPQQAPDTGEETAPVPQGPPLEHPKTTSEDDLKQFVSVVLADTEDVWQDIFRRYGETYSDPKLVLYSGAIRSACGTGMAAMGPFYCPNDEKVYIDLSFYQ